MYALREHDSSKRGCRVTFTQVRSTFLHSPGLLEVAGGRTVDNFALKSAARVAVSGARMIEKTSEALRNSPEELSHDQTP